MEVRKLGKKKSGKKEKRGFTIHGREFWLSKDQIQKEFGCPPEDVDKIWEGGKLSKPEKPSKPAKPHTAEPAEPAAKKPSEVLAERVYTEMKRLQANGITECTSTLLKDNLKLDKEAGRGQVRNAVKKLEENGKVVIAVKEGKRKQYTYKLVE